MSGRMAKLDRLLALVHALGESADGLTLDEMAGRLGVDRRTAERMRDVIALHFDLEERTDDRRKRFFIRDSLRRVYTRPNAAEVAALQAEADARTAAGQAGQAALLTGLLSKLRAGLDVREKRRMDPDLEALLRLQRALIPAGPSAVAAPEALAEVQRAILTGCCLEFDYQAETQKKRVWRRVIPFGLVHGPLTYLVGQFPDREVAPVYYRLDRMHDVRATELPGQPPEEFDLDAWVLRSFGVWHDAQHDIVLRVLPTSAARARQWRFHPSQTVEEGEDGTLLIRFRAGGLRELAEHVFTWGGELVIEEPRELKEIMRERLDLAATSLGPE